MSYVRIVNVCKNFGDHAILKNIDLEVKAGEFLVLVGPSGCGKSTLLRVISGLEEANSGDIFLGDKRVNDLAPQARDVAMVFQSYALYPHLSVYENMAFALKLAKVPMDEIKRRVEETAGLLHITDFLGRRPRDLSGGQRQRVALGRALVRRAPLVLFDEPLSNLDANLRQQMRIEIKSIHRQIQNTVVYVTHDQIEATTMGDRIAVLKDGRIEQIATPSEIYAHPRNTFVASFIGSPEINLLALSEQHELQGLNEAFGREVKIGVRPEHLRLYNKEGLKPIGHGEITFVENLGAQYLYHVKSGRLAFRVLQTPRDNLQIGVRAAIYAELDKCHRFNPQTGLNL